MHNIDFSVGIGGAAGQGVATPGNILAKLFARRGLHINAYNAYQSIIRGGHTFLTIRTSREPVHWRPALVRQARPPARDHGPPG